MSGVALALQLATATQRAATGDSLAMELLARARVAQATQDTALRSYDARSYQRTTIGYGMRSFGIIADATPPIPYYPGFEALWLKGSAVDWVLQPFAIAHPFAAGAESLYGYRAGDSLSLRLPSGRVIHARELRVQPRVASPNMIEGSFLASPGFVSIASKACLSARKSTNRSVAESMRACSAGSDSPTSARTSPPA